MDLQAQYQSIKPEIDGAIQAVIEKGAFISGPFARQFEEDFKQYVGTEYCMSCGNGTDAIEILLQAMGIGPGDEVIVPAISWIATSEAVSTVGATPIFVDLHPETYTIDPNLIEAKITKKTKAIIPVHLYGNPADMPAIMKIAASYNLKVLEDCAQAHGAEIAGKRIGGWGDASSFSFYPGKNLGAYGDAGAMLTNDEEIAVKAKMIANHGQLKKHNHQMEGRNSRLDGIQAAILSAKLPHIESWTEKRISRAAKYQELLADSVITLPQVRPGDRHVYHVYVIQIDNRDQVKEKLQKAGITSLIHYPTPLPLLPPYAHQGHKPEDFPVASSMVQRILSPPIYPELTDEMIEYVVDHLLH